MTTQTKIQQELFPDIPRDPQAVDENGRLTQLWSLGLSNIFQALQANFKREGIMIPPLTQDQVDSIEDLYTPYIGVNYNEMLKVLPDISGQTIYDSTNSVPKIFVITKDGSNIVTAASWKTFTIV